MRSSEPQLGCSRFCGRAEVGLVTSGSAGHHEAAQPGSVALQPQRAPLRLGLEAPPEPPRRPQVGHGRGAARGWLPALSRPSVSAAARLGGGPPRARILGTHPHMRGVLGLHQDHELAVGHRKDVIAGHCALAASARAWEGVRPRMKRPRTGNLNQMDKLGLRGPSAA